MGEGINLRKFPRIASKVDVEIRKKDLLEHVVTYTENLSAGGLCVVIDRAVQPFDVLTVHLTLDDNTVVDVKGRVVWSVKKHLVPKQRMKYDVGIEFLEVSHEDHELLRAFIKNAQRDDSIGKE